MNPEGNIYKGVRETPVVSAFDLILTGTVTQPHMQTGSQLLRRHNLVNISGPLALTASNRCKYTIWESDWLCKDTQPTAVTVSKAAC